MRAWRYLARAYLDLQHLRMACWARMRKMSEAGNVPEDVMKIMSSYYKMLLTEEKALLRKISKRLKEHPLWSWCNRVKGMGAVACLTFLGFIDPFKADTAGKAKAYFGIIPGRELRSGKRANMNPEAKGRGGRSRPPEYG